MAQGELAQKILQALETALAKQEPELELVDVEIVGATKAPTLRVLLDTCSQEAITLDEISEKTALISSLVEELDPFSSSYNLEVSSPGVDRPLRTPEHFKRFLNQRCELQTTAQEGRKKWTGTIKAVDKDSLCLELDGQDYSFAFSEIKKAKLKAELNFKPKA